MLNITAMLAGMTHAPEIQLSAEEAHAIAASAAELSKHYKIPVVSDKHLALGTFLMVCGNIARAHIMAARTRILREKTAPKTVQPGQAAPSSQAAQPWTASSAAAAESYEWLPMSAPN